MFRQTPRLYRKLVRFDWPRLISICSMWTIRHRSVDDYVQVGTTRVDEVVVKAVVVIVANDSQWRGVVVVVLV